MRNYQVTQQQKAQEQQARNREEQRKQQIAIELAEARIKARQALRMDEEEEAAVRETSPTSVAVNAFVNFSPEKMSDLPGLDDSDGDIQEIEDDD